MNRLARAAFPVTLLLIVAATALTALTLAGSMAAPLPGLPDAGTLTRWVLPAARALHDAAATVTIGFLVVAAAVLPQDPASPGTLGRAGARAMLFAAITGSVWTVAGTVVLTFSYADVAGTDPLGPGASAPAMISFILELALGRSLAVNVLFAAAAATGAWLATRTTTAGVCAVLALAALLPLTVTAHGASNHEDAVNLLALHLIGVTVWAGGLAAMYFLRRQLNGALAPAVRRYSMLAGWCFVLVAFSGVGSALLRLQGPASLGTPYGVLLMLKTAALVLLGVAGWVHRARAIPALEHGPHGRALFGRVAGVELALMAATVGLAVALGRSSPFGTNPVKSTAESLLGYPLPPGLGPAQWLIQWHPDVVWAPTAVLLAGGYCAAVRRWNRGANPWPRRRTLSWLLGCVLLAWASSGAPAAYGRLLPGMHVLGETMIGLAVPALLVLGAPGVLARGTLPRRSDGSRGLREWAHVLLNSRAVRWLCRPAPALALYTVFVLGYYFTPVLRMSLSNNPFRLAATAVALCVGLNLAAALLKSSAQGSRAVRRSLMWVLAAVAAVHVGAGLAVMFWGMQSGDWYLYIRSLWSFSPTAQQRTAGEVLWGAGLLPLLILGVAILGAAPAPCRAPAPAAPAESADQPARKKVGSGSAGA